MGTSLLEESIYGGLDVIVAQKCNFLNRVIFACDLFDTQIIPLIFDFVKRFCKNFFEFFEIFCFETVVAQE